MNTIVKTSMAVGLAATMATFGTSNARAGGWPIAAGVIGGLAVGTAIGATVASASAPPAYVYPAYPYPAYTYAAPAPAVQPVQPTVVQPVRPVAAPAPATVYVQPAPVYTYPAPVVYAGPYACGYPYGYPCVRLGWGYRGYRGYYYGPRHW